MSLEIERRFLVLGNGWRKYARSSNPLRQGYLVTSLDGFTIRTRLRGIEQAWLTLKSPVDCRRLSHYEFEYEIPVADAEAMWNLAAYQLEKNRFEIDYPGGEWVVDCFKGKNAPLVLAEVELLKVDAHLHLPDWCVEEVTGQSRWSNAALAKQPFQSWEQTLKDRYELI